MRTRNFVAASAAFSLLLLGVLVAPAHDAPAPTALPLSAQLTAATRTTSAADGGGYWLVSADGRVFAFGGAHLYGSMAGTHLRSPITGIVATASHRGYWLVAADGGVFSFGDAQFSGSLGADLFASPIVGMASSTSPSIGGTDGSNGAPGANGTDGAAGPTGPQGPPGSNGAVGVTGPTGATGPAGSIVGTACTRGTAAGTIAQDVDATTGVVTITCTTLAFDPALLSGDWGSVSGSGLQPGTFLTACADQFACQLQGGLPVQSDGTANGGPIFPCASGDTNVYFTGVTAAGDAITSNVVATATC
jgi:hypothetical protein